MSGISHIVTIEDGQLEGTTKIDWLGRNYFSFQGIPYAKPPIGDLRFKAPLPAEPWKGVRDATKEGSNCFSRHFLTFKVVGSEDCLYLNVYTPQLPSDGCKLKPVMVWIHGGGFVNGSGSTEEYGPEFLVSEDVVIVTINYRLGLLGFSCFSNPSLGAPGNAGLKDQVLALKWVQKNISKFNGDPKNVTIFGESAGGAAVHLLMLSLSAKGLFHKVIAQSGVAISAWCKGQETAPLIAKHLGCEGANETEVFNVLKELPAAKILEIQEKLPELVTLSERRSCAIVAEPYKTDSAFLLQEPEDILTSGHYCDVPLMLGYTSRDGMFYEFFQKMIYGEIKWISDYENIIPFPLKIARGSTAAKALAKKIQQFYYGDETPSVENIDKYYLIFTDVIFLVDIHNSIKKHLKTSSSPIYYYRMSIESCLNTFKKLASLKAPGVSHGDDIGYLFKNALTPTIWPNSLEEIGLKRFLKLWTSFAKNGNPNSHENDELITITWPAVENKKHHFLDIGENLTVGVNPEAERIKFWEEIFNEYSSK